MIRRLESSLGREPRQQVGDIEIAENIDASERAVHFELLPDADAVAAGGRRAGRGRDRRIVRASGECADDGAVRIDDVSATRSSARGWIATSDRFSRAIDTCWRRLSSGCCRTSRTGPLVDLYAGVGLFSLTAKAAGAGPDHRRRRRSVRGARSEAQREGRDRGAWRCRWRSFARARRPAAVIVDPPRTGMSKEALARAIELDAPQLRVCVVRRRDAGARCARVAGCGLPDHVSARVRLFPNTAHVETVIAFASRVSGALTQALRTARGTRRSARSSPDATARRRRTARRASPSLRSRRPARSPSRRSPAAACFTD